MVRPLSMDLRERAVARIADGPGASHYPSAMFSPFSVLTVRSNKLVQVVDLSSSTPGLNSPCSTPPCYLNYDRMWGNATVLADGKILVSGGSAIYNQIYDSSGNDVDPYQVGIYHPNPPPGTWTLGDSASQPRLYHSAALLLPDGSVLTGGGGAPGPVNELNVEIYYPAYLYLNRPLREPGSAPDYRLRPVEAKVGPDFLRDCGKQRSDRRCQPHSGWLQHPFIQSGATADPCAVLSEWTNGHWESKTRSGKNSAGLLYTLRTQHSGRAGSGEDCRRPPSGPVSLVESTEGGFAPSSRLWLLGVSDLLQD